MHISSSFFLDNPLLGPWALGVYALVALVGLTLWVIAGSDTRPKLAGTIIGALGGLLVVLIGVFGTANIESSYDASLRSQAKQVYGLDLSSQQVRYLVHGNSGLFGSNSQEQGSAYVQIDGKLQKVTLIDLGDTQLLVKDGTRTELPRVN